MRIFTLTNDARAHLKSIGVYNDAQWGEARRATYLKELDDAFHLLASNPQLGEDCSFIDAGLRKHPKGSHVIFYSIVSDLEIEVTGVLHKTQIPFNYIVKSRKPSSSEPSDNTP